MPDRYRVLVEVGAGLGLRQGEALGLSADDFDFAKEVVHVRRQVKVVRTKLCFALPKGRKVRDVPLPKSVALAVQRHMEVFAPVPVTLPWDDPRPPETPVEAKHRRAEDVQPLGDGTRAEGGQPELLQPLCLEVGPGRSRRHRSTTGEQSERIQSVGAVP
ncbi:hypothetical protein OG609_36850 [Streptomyces sp. NBC_01224]|nr:hypothetical protein OG609_36850 [Streptomyces sp. NBC_01224]